jgi:hypothetical protein
LDDLPVVLLLAVVLLSVVVEVSPAAVVGLLVDVSTPAPVVAVVPASLESAELGLAFSLAMSEACAEPWLLSRAVVAALDGDPAGVEADVGLEPAMAVVASANPLATVISSVEIRVISLSCFRVRRASEPNAIVSPPT